MVFEKLEWFCRAGLLLMTEDQPENTRECLWDEDNTIPDVCCSPIRQPRQMKCGWVHTTCHFSCMQCLFLCTRLWHRPCLPLHPRKMQESSREVEFPPHVFPTNTFPSLSVLFYGDLNSKSVLFEVLQGFGKHKSQYVLAVFKELLEWTVIKTKLSPFQHNFWPFICELPISLACLYKRVLMREQLGQEFAI